MKHTPGPWHWDESNPMNHKLRSGEEFILSTVWHPSCPDACLISAAPDLIDALKKAHDFIYLHGDEDKSKSFKTILRTIQTAISKATFEDGKPLSRSEFIALVDDIKEDNKGESGVKNFWDAWAKLTASLKGWLAYGPVTPIKHIHEYERIGEVVYGDQVHVKYSCKQCGSTFECLEVMISFDAKMTLVMKGDDLSIQITKDPDPSSHHEVSNKPT